MLSVPGLSGLLGSSEVYVPIVFDRWGAEEYGVASARERSISPTASSGSVGVIWGSWRCGGSVEADEGDEEVGVGRYLIVVEEVLE